MDTILASLRRLRTPIVYDAIERFGLRPRQDGYTDASIRSLLPSLGAFAGYAVTGRIMAELPHESGSQCVPWQDVWTYVDGQRKPSIMVSQDLDQPSGRGCAWGDVAASIFRRLGCVAVITNGTARDISEVEAVGFGLFAQGQIVGHANIRFVEIGGLVKVGGLVVKSGRASARRRTWRCHHPGRDRSWRACACGRAVHGLGEVGHRIHAHLGDFLHPRAEAANGSP